MTMILNLIKGIVDVVKALSPSEALSLGIFVGTAMIGVAAGIKTAFFSDKKKSKKTKTVYDDLIDNEDSDAMVERIIKSNEHQKRYRKYLKKHEEFPAIYPLNDRALIENNIDPRLINKSRKYPTTSNRSMNWDDILGNSRKKSYSSTKEKSSVEPIQYTNNKKKITHSLLLNYSLAEIEKELLDDSYTMADIKLLTKRKDELLAIKEFERIQKKKSSTMEEAGKKIFGNKTIGNKYRKGEINENFIETERKIYAEERFGFGVSALDRLDGIKPKNSQSRSKIHKKRSLSKNPRYQIDF